MTVYDAILCLIPLALLLKIVLCILAHHLEKRHAGDLVDLAGPLALFLVHFNSRLTTAFTIVFVTIMTTAVRRLALWKAQRGAYLIELEQLQASISLPSAVKVALSLRAFRIRTAILLIIWSFYYIGSQATKHEFSLTDSIPHQALSAAYASPGVPSRFAGNRSELDLSYQNQQMTTYLVGTESSNEQGYDIFGSVLVPSLETALDPYGASTNLMSSANDITPARPDAQGWYDVSRPSNNVWTSYVGLQLYVYDDTYGAPFDIYINEKVLGNFEFRAKYTTVNCSHPEIQPYEAFPSGTLPGIFTSLNMSSTSARTGNKTNEATHLELWFRWNDTDPYSGKLHRGSWKSACDLKTSHVDVRAHCGVTGCFARSMRYSEDDGRLKKQTHFGDTGFASAFLSDLLLSAGIPTPAGDGLVGVNIGAFWALDDTYSSWRDIKYTMKKISLSLELQINTYFSLSQVTEIHDSLVEDQDDPDVALTTLHGAIYRPQYRISIPWIVVDFMACTILLGAAVFSFWLRRRTLAPDIFGYVSTLTRDNLYLGLPAGGSTLSGLHRARLLKNVKIRIGDVSAIDEDVGRVGVTCSGGVPLDQTYLNGERLYA